MSDASMICIVVTYSISIWSNTFLQLFYVIRYYALMLVGEYNVHAIILIFWNKVLSY